MTSCLTKIPMKSSMRKACRKQNSIVHRKQSTIANRRIECLISSRKTNWADTPATIGGAVTRVKARISEWNARKLGKNKRMEEIASNDEHSPQMLSDLVGILRAAESKKRIMLLRRYITRLRDARCKYLVSLQANAIDSIRLEKLLQASQAERMKPNIGLFKSNQRVEEILHYDFSMLFGKQNW